jgi:hypothetical protein
VNDATYCSTVVFDLVPHKDILLFFYTSSKLDLDRPLILFRSTVNGSTFKVSGCRGVLAYSSLPCVGKLKPATGEGFVTCSRAPPAGPLSTAFGRGLVMIIAASGQKCKHRAGNSTIAGECASQRSPPSPCDACTGTHGHHDNATRFFEGLKVTAVCRKINDIRHAAYARFILTFEGKTPTLFFGVRR